MSPNIKTIDNFKLKYTSTQVNRENLWFLIDVFCQCVWLNKELRLQSLNTDIVMDFKKSSGGLMNCYIAREDWGWFIEIFDLPPRWLFLEEDDLKYYLSKRFKMLYGDPDQFEQDLILFKLFL